MILARIVTLMEGFLAFATKSEPGILEDYTISGVCDGRFNSGYLWTPLATVQEHLGAAGKLLGRE